MSTMQQLITKVQTELRFQSGVAVQIAQEAFIAQTISREYRKLMKQFVWRDYYKITALTTLAVDGSTATDMSAYLTKSSNILAIYNDRDREPLPWIPVMSNPALHHRPGIVATNTAKVFSIYPWADRNITLISRGFQETDFALGDTVPFYDDLLVVAAARKLATISGVNEDLKKDLSKEFNDLVDMYRADELKDSYQVSPAKGQYPTEWYTND